MKFKEFTQYLEKLETISSRNEMVVVLAELISSLEQDEVKQAMYLLQGRIAPLFVPLEFNVSTKLLIRVLSQLKNQDAEAIYKLKGDIGLAAESLIDWQGEGVEINEVFTKLVQIAVIEGKDSQSKKINEIVSLLKKVSGTEARYITRAIVGKLRLGLSDKTVLDALSWMKTGDKSLRVDIEHAFGVSADLGLIAETLVAKGIDAVRNMEVHVGVPIAVKLVEREKDMPAIFNRLGRHLIQPKYDGLRAQMHFSKSGFEQIISTEQQDLLNFQNDNARIFSRRMENLTFMFPDITDALNELGVDSIILDSEIIAFDPTNNELLSFQETMKRKRKTDIAVMAGEIPVKAICFDILYLNGESLLRTKLEERMLKLKLILEKADSRIITLSDSPVVESEADAQEYFEKYVAQGLEGLISKSLETFYDPGTRNYDWIKLKGASQSHLADSIDAVVLGYYLGTGIRAKFGIGAILIGVYDDKTDKYISVAKVGTGIKDEQFITIKNKLDSIKVDTIPENYEIDKALVPDVLVRPEIVVVVEADSISKSQVHGYRGEEGFSLRFPRLKVFDRTDKAPEDTTSPTELEKLYKIQFK